MVDYAVMWLGVARLQDFVAFVLARFPPMHRNFIELMRHSNTIYCYRWGDSNLLIGIDSHMPGLTAFSALDPAWQEATTLDGTLQERLAALQRALSSISPGIDQAYEKLVARLKTSRAEGFGPQVGATMSKFLLPNDAGGFTSLDELLASGPTVVSFNRGHWCHHCMLELLSLARILPAAEALGARVVSIVPERQRFSRELKSRCNLPFPVLSDVDNAYGLSIGLVFHVGHELQALYKENQLDFRELQGCESWMLPVPATFVLDRSGSIVSRFIDPDFRRRMEPDAIVAVLEDLHNQSGD